MAATPYPAYGIEKNGWFCRQGKRSATRVKLQRPRFPPGLVRREQRGMGGGFFLGPEWVYGWFETKSFFVGYKKNAGWR
ncbi:hypothetical protein, partial [Enterobacter intestinihominis]